MFLPIICNMPDTQSCRGISSIEPSSDSKYEISWSKTGTLFCGEVDPAEGSLLKDSLDDTIMVPYICIKQAHLSLTS